MKNFLSLSKNPFLNNKHNFLFNSKKLFTTSSVDSTITIDPTTFTSELNSENSTTRVKKNQLYIWLSNVSPGRRKDDYKNLLILSNVPKKIDFFDDKNPVELFMGPRHSGVVTENGDLYTFGTGNWGVLGHGNERNIDHSQPKLVEYFYKNNLRVKKVCMGDFHTMALTEDGGVYTWGFGGKKGFLNLLFTGNYNLNK